METNWSYGLGTQSTAILILIAQGRLPKPDRVVIADTGREAGYGWAYFRQYAEPLMRELGIPVEIAPHSLATVDLYAKNGDLLIPAFTKRGKLDTLCSVEWKRRVVRRWLRSQGVRRCVTWLGISTDELERIKPSDVKWQQYHWPLCLDVPMSRNNCRLLVQAWGWPDPPRSSCLICPHRQDAEWLLLSPEERALANQTDADIRQHDARHDVYLYRGRVPLATVTLTPNSRSGLFDACDSGYCWT